MLEESNLFQHDETQLKSLKEFKLPFVTHKGTGIIKVGGTTIGVKGCYTTNSTDMAFLGFGVLKASYGIVVFEEAKEFDQETVNAVLVAIRGLKYQTNIYRSNPYHANNWFTLKCYSQVPIDEYLIVNGDCNQGEVKDDK